MAIDIDDFLLPEDEPAGAPSSAPSDSGILARLWARTPEGGGPRGGRDQSLTDMAGALRRRRFTLDEAVVVCNAWDTACCEPPIGPAAIQEKLARFWVEWLEGADPLLTPEAVRGGTTEIEFLTMPQMAEQEEELGALKWLLDNVLPEGGLIYFAAAPAGAKTWVMLDLAKAFVTGDPWLGKFDVEMRNVLYIDEEMGLRKALPRLRKLGIPDDATGFWYTDKAGVRFDSPKHVAQILAHCEANDVKVVFIDTLTRVHDLDENDNSQMRRLFRAFSILMDKGITVIIAHHDRKKGADSDVRHERMRGAGEIAAMADMAYAIDRAGNVFRLTTSKTRLVAEEHEIKLDFTIKDSDDGTTVTIREVTDAEKAQSRIGHMAKMVRDALLDGPMFSRELEGAVKGRKGEVLEAAKWLAEAGEIERWRLDRKVYYAYPGSRPEAATDYEPED